MGDELMVTGRARVMQQTDPRRVRATYKGKPRWSPIFDNNPRFATPDQRGDIQELVARDRITNLRPYMTAKAPDRYTYNLDFRPDAGEIYFDQPEKEFGSRYGGRVIVEPHIKMGASPNKQWGWIKWNKVSWLLGKRGVRLTQLGAPGTPLLDGADFVPTPSFRMAAAVLSGARAAILPEGGTHHAAAALGVRAVVIFGGFIPVELTGYSIHRNLGASLGAACGMRVPCPHCSEWMERIKPEMVADELMAILK